MLCGLDSKVCRRRGCSCLKGPIRGWLITASQKYATFKSATQVGGSDYGEIVLTEFLWREQQKITPCSIRAKALVWRAF